MHALYSNTSVNLAVVGRTFGSFQEGLWFSIYLRVDKHKIVTQTGRGLETDVN